MLGIRYEMDASFIHEEHVGFMIGVEYAYEEAIITTDQLLAMMQRFYDEIPEPGIRMVDTVSFFTKYGYDSVSADIAKLSDMMKKYGAEMRRIEMDIPDNSIIYQDRYQLIIKRNSYLLSSPVFPR